jgi:hypothetical protein
MISMAEMRELLHEQSAGEDTHEEGGTTASPYTHQETGS